MNPPPSCFRALSRSILRVAALALLLPAAAMAADGTVVLRGGWLLDGVREEPVRNRGILVLRGRLHAVNADVRAPEDARVISLGNDDYILPGLVDLHAHYNVRLHRKRREEIDVIPVIYLANGVTSTFPAGSFDPELMLETRRRIDRGERIGPRIHGAGPYFGPARPGWDPEMTAEEIHAEVDHWAELGVRGFKAKRISTGHLEALVERAHMHGLTVTGHLDSGYGDTINPRDAILLGIDRVEHFLGGDAIDPERPAYDTLVDFRTGTPEFKRIVDLYLRHGVYFDATLTAYGYYGDREQAYDHWIDERRYLTPYAREITEDTRQQIDRFGKIFQVKLKTIRAFYEAGGGHLITLGTDHPSAGEYIAGFSAHRELHALVLAGIPAAAALRIGTINGARALGLGDQLGSIEVGKWADLMVIKGNPLHDIRRTRTVHTVVKGGIVYETAALLRSVENRLGPSGPEDLDEW